MTSSETWRCACTKAPGKGEGRVVSCCSASRRPAGASHRPAGASHRPAGASHRPMNTARLENVQASWRRPDTRSGLCAQPPFPSTTTTALLSSLFSLSLSLTDGCRIVGLDRGGRSKRLVSGLKTRKLLKGWMVRSAEPLWEACRGGKIRFSITTATTPPTTKRMGTTSSGRGSGCRVVGVVGRT